MVNHELAMSITVIDIATYKSLIIEVLKSNIGKPSYLQPYMWLHHGRKKPPPTLNVLAKRGPTWSLLHVETQVSQSSYCNSSGIIHSICNLEASQFQQAAGVPGTCIRATAAGPAAAAGVNRSRKP